MKIKDPSITLPSKLEETVHMHHLERQQCYLLSLENQLRSYHCVPKTPKLYEQMEKLKLRLRELMEENENLIFSIHKKGIRSQQTVANCNIQFQKVAELEREILEYIGKAKIHG